MSDPTPDDISAAIIQLAYATAALADHQRLSQGVAKAERLKGARGFIAQAAKLIGENP